MPIDRNTILFFDASCLIASAGSPTGGSGFLLSLCARGILKAAVSHPVLIEAQRNIQSKLGDTAVDHFYNLIAVVPFSMVPLPGETRLKQLEKFANKKDVHVLAAALEIRASYLLTLDKGFISEINKTRLGVQALTPGDFIKTVLPGHEDYGTGDKK